MLPKIAFQILGTTKLHLGSQDPGSRKFSGPVHTHTSHKHFLSCLLTFIVIQIIMLYILGGWTQVSDSDCYGACGKKGGLCEKYCGVGGYCCRKGYRDCPKLAGDASPKHHTCVNAESKYVYKLLHFTTSLVSGTFIM